MIARIVIGSGNSRTAINLPADRDTRRTLSNKLKGSMFQGTYHAEKARGAAAMQEYAA